MSLDLPFAQQPWCTEAKIENFKNLSDVHNQSFGKNYGVLIQGLPIPLLARAVFVVDPTTRSSYVEIVPEIVQEPNYEPALSALKKARGRLKIVSQSLLGRCWGGRGSVRATVLQGQSEELARTEPRPPNSLALPTAFPSSIPSHSRRKP